MAGMVGGVPGAPSVPGTQKPWPPLREELSLVDGPRTRFGAPTWTLYDPSGQKFFRLGWLELEIVRRWKLGNAAAVAAAIARDTTLAPTPGQVEATVAFAVNNQWTVAAGREAVERLLQQRRRQRAGLFMAVMKNYLFLRIPLVRPDRFLAATRPWVEWMFSRAFAAVMTILALLGLYLIGRQWSQFGDTFAAMFTLEGGFLAMAALGLSKTAHELGHAYAAKRHGLRVPGMGVALMCFMPVLWTDTSEAWRLPRRRDRLSIGISGVAAELSLATLAALLWPVLPPGSLKTGAFMLVGSAWIATLAVNANPFMRYDGYYLLSDYWDLPGLQTRSFALAKWWLRERLFGFGRPPPEAFPAWDRNKLILYALATWLYRFFLFLGIALLVYHFFFKALGLVLMVVELAFFIAMPVVKEMIHWAKHTGELTMNRRFLGTLLAAAALAVLFCWPWHGGVGGGAILLPQRQATLYAPRGAVIASRPAENGRTAAPGEILLTLRSPDLDARMELAQTKIAVLREKIALASLDPLLRADTEQDWRELESLAGDLAGMGEERERLVLRAPFAGTVTELPNWAVPGAWVMAREGLVTVAAAEREVQAFVSEDDWSRLDRPDAAGRFYAIGKGFAPMPFRVVSVDRQALTEIPFPELASTQGGPLGAHKAGDNRLVPEHALYRVVGRIEPGEGAGLSLVGQATIEGEPRSLAGTVWRNLLGLLVRESAW